MSHRIFTAESPSATRLSAVITTPEDYTPDESLPLILFLHGIGSRGSNVEQLLGGGIIPYFQKDGLWHSVRAITVSPQCPEGHFWPHMMIPLKTLLDEVAEQYAVSSERISITGLSMGGFGTWEMLMTYPGLFSRAAPICGGGIPWNPEAFRQTEIRAFHGTDDDVVPILCSEMMVGAAKRCGAPLTFTTFDNVGHNSWTPAYETTDLIPWLAFSETE